MVAPKEIYFFPPCNEDGSFQILDSISSQISQNLDQHETLYFRNKLKDFDLVKSQQIGPDPFAIFIESDSEFLENSQQHKKLLEKNTSNSRNKKRKRDDLELNQSSDLDIFIEEESLNLNRKSPNILSDSDSDSSSNSYVSVGTLSSLDLKIVSRVKNSKNTINENKQKESKKMIAEDINIYINVTQTNEQSQIKKVKLEKKGKHFIMNFD